jgi:hypothetical protein
MELALALALSLLVLIIGAVFVVFPDRILRIAARGSKSYMPEDGLTSDPVYSLMFRAFGIAAIGLGLYMVYQLLRV